MSVTVPHSAHPIGMFARLENGHVRNVKGVHKNDSAGKEEGITDSPLAQHKSIDNCRHLGD